MSRASSDDVAARLRSALTLDFASLREGVDMSPDAVVARLREACELSTLCLALGDARRASEEQR